MRLPALAAVAVCVLLGGCSPEPELLPGERVKIRNTELTGTVMQVSCWPMSHWCTYRVRVDGGGNPVQARFVWLSDLSIKLAPAPDR